MKEVFKHADVISFHVPDLPATRNLLNAKTIRDCKKGSVIINYARGHVVDLDALKRAIEDGHIQGAAVDVFPEEPEKNGDPFSTPLQGVSNVILTPHIGGSTEEAQLSIGEDVSNKLFHYLEKGISTGSLSVPALSLPLQENTHRILHIHKNVPGVLSEINSRLSSDTINIVGQYLKTNDKIGYVVLDIEANASKDAIKLLRGVKETIKVRLLY